MKRGASDIQREAKKIKSKQDEEIENAVTGLALAFSTDIDSLNIESLFDCSGHLLKATLSGNYNDFRSSLLRYNITKIDFRLAKINFLNLSHVISALNGTQVSEFYLPSLGFDQPFVELLEALAGNNTLKKLGIGDIEINESVARSFAQVLIENQSLEELTFFLTKIDKKGAAWLDWALDSNSTLRKIELMASPIPPKILKSIENKLAVNQMLYNNKTSTLLGHCTNKLIQFSKSPPVEALPCDTNKKKKAVRRR